MRGPTAGMFHVEHEFRRFIEESGLAAMVDDRRLEKYSAFTALVVEASTRFNLTGHKTPGDVFVDLVIGSIAPLARLNVPRGTFVDIGTGAGVPGIPLAILYPDLTGTLIDSNAKKAAFVRDVIQQLELPNLTAICGRVEEIAHDRAHRGRYDWVLSRAFNALYVTLELGAPLAGPQGRCYVYSRETFGSLPQEILAHAHALGLVPSTPDDHERVLGCSDGLLFRKAARTPDRYPRRYTIIKRDAQRIG